jgi:predicted metal-binding protein
MDKRSPRKSKKRSLDTLIEAIFDQGASEARCISARDVVVDERVRFKCMVPLCESFNRNLMCPPNLPSIEEFRNILAHYTDAILIQITSQMAKKPVKKSHDVFAPAKQLHSLINQAEKKAFEHGFCFAAGLIGGCCRLCNECVAATGHEPCRHPFKARPSMEAMGIDVMATLRKAGMDCSFPIEDHVKWTGLLLVQ